VDDCSHHGWRGGAGSGCVMGKRKERKGGGKGNV